MLRFAQSTLTLIVGLAFGCAPAGFAQAPPTPGYSVLLVVVDDLRPTLGAYGVDYAISPHLDGLAARGATFERAYAQAPICSPSRMSLLTGQYVTQTGIRNNGLRLREALPDVVTLPQRFRRAGYQATAQGKVFHGGLGDSLSWDRYADGPKNRAVYQLAKNRAINDVTDPNRRGRPYESADVPDDAYTDGQIADRAIADLRGYRRDRPFFLAVGLLKPHLPFLAPRRYRDAYPTDASEIYPRPLARPDGAPAYAFTEAGELRRYGTVPAAGPMPPALQDSLVRGYLACVSYADAQVGRLLAELERLGRADSTVVVVLGDHGFKLGELGDWAKNTPYELDARVPLIVYHPGLAPTRTAAVVELVDVYPTLLALTGLDAPDGQALAGESLLPLLLGRAAAAADGLAFTETRRRGAALGPDEWIYGLSVRDSEHRLIEWRPASSPDSLLSRELYDYAADGGVERVNRADDPAYAAEVARLSDALAAYRRL